MYRALLRIGWKVKAQKAGSHFQFERDGRPTRGLFTMGTNSPCNAQENRKTYWAESERLIVSALLRKPEPWTGQSSSLIAVDTLDGSPVVYLVNA